MELTTITLRVPPDRVADVYAFAAVLYRRGRTAPAMVTAGPDATDEPGEPDRPDGLDDDAVRRAYLGGRSEAWRPFLDVLADHGDQWVSWRALCREIGRTPAQAAGMLGAAERRCKQYPPYEKSGWTDGDRWFRMPEHAAAVVRALASEG